MFYQAEYPLLKTVFLLIWSCSGASIQLSQHHLHICGGREPCRFIFTAWDNLSSRVSVTWLPPGSRKPMLVYLLLDQFCKEQKAQQSPPRHHSLCCSLCKSDLSRKRSCIKHSILLSGKINALFNSLLLYSASGTMKPCSVLSTKATGANHLRVITLRYPGKPWGELGALPVLLQGCAESSCALHHASHSSHSSLPDPPATDPPQPAAASSALSNGKMCPVIKTVNLQ